MIVEKDLKELERQQEQGIAPTPKVMKDIIKTLDALWHVYRAAHRWRVALHGRPAVEAEAELRKSMEAVKVK